jgi:hypothetical protein
MKKIGLFIVIMIGVLLHTACDDEDKNPLPNTLGEGAFIKFVSEPSFAVDVSNLASATFTSKIEDPAGNVQKYELFMLATVGGTVQDTVPIKTISSFPSDLNISSSDIAGALDIDLEDLGPGDAFQFFAHATRTDGTVYSHEAPQYSSDKGYNGNLTSETLISETGYMNALQFNVLYSCPFNVGDAVGTYRIIVDDFETSVGDDLFEVNAGPRDNQIIMVSPFDHVNPLTGEEDYNVVIDVEPTSGAASITLQSAWHCDNFGCSYGLGSIETVGSLNFAFSCTGTITLLLQHSVAAGRFGSFRFVAEKVD